MRRDARKYLHDVLQSADLILRFADGRELIDYQNDPLLRSGIERQFLIVGEALFALSKTHPGLLARITEVNKIVRFRHILVHGYNIVDDELVWGLIRNKLLLLRNEVSDILEQLNGQT